MRKIRARLYKLGFRPRKRSIWYSPSLNLIYAMEDFGKELDDILDTNSKMIRKALDLNEQ